MILAFETLHEHGWVDIKMGHKIFTIFTNWGLIEIATDPEGVILRKPLVPLATEAEVLSFLDRIDFGAIALELSL